jgi:hypothetical protein
MGVEYMPHGNDRRVLLTGGPRGERFGLLIEVPCRLDAQRRPPEMLRSRYKSGNALLYTQRQTK